MTSLEPFECSNCGAKVERPEPGKSIECPFCKAELMAPEPPAPVVVREIIRERVVEQAPPPVDFRAPSPGSSRRTGVAIALVVAAGGFIAIMATLSSASDDSDRRQAKWKAQQSCEQDCKKDCDKRFSEPASAASDKSAATPGSDEWVKKMRRDGDKSTCEADCTTHCYK